MSTEWTYQGEVLQDESIPTGAFGFIYLITQLSTGKKYIGKKLLSSASTKVVNGKKKKIRKTSDWKNYWSSSPDVKDAVKECGKEDFTREILTFCHSRGSVSYCEELALYQMGVLESDEWFNRNIRAKVFKNWVKVDDAKALRHSLALHSSSSSSSTKFVSASGSNSEPQNGQ